VCMCVIHCKGGLEGGLIRRCNIWHMTYDIEREGLVCSKDKQTVEVGRGGFNTHNTHNMVFYSVIVL
jgi:hypothetical protein